jgi:diguanylate cyclase (GGDEF)-like protein
MRHDIPANGEPLAPLVPGDADEAMLRSEIARLQRENRTLTIALAEMERVAERDMLTPLFNRRYFLSALHQRIARSERFGDRIALIYVDVDNLKQINDRHGHGAGDFALIEIAARLASAMRPCDVLARIGGDEFGILLDHISQSEATGKMRRFKAMIEDEPCCYEGRAIELGAAFGLAMITPGQSAEDLVGRADAAMYRDKRG